jgi:hypothetical protein
MENKTSIFWNSVLLNGVILGIIGIIIQLLLWMFDYIPVGISGGLISLAVSLLIYVTLLFIFTKNYRDKSMGGILPYGKAFVYGLAVFVAAAVIGAIYNYIFLSFIDPEYQAKVVERSVAWTQNFMASKGIPEATISESIDKIREKALPSPLMASLKTLPFSVIMGAIVSLISSAFAKKEEKPFEVNR